MKANLWALAAGLAAAVAVPVVVAVLLALCEALFHVQAGDETRQGLAWLAGAAGIFVGAGTAINVAGVVL